MGAAEGCAPGEGSPPGDGHHLQWEAFDFLLQEFKQRLRALWESRKSGCPNSKGAGRLRKLQELDVLGLTLAWLHTPTWQQMLCLVWGCNPSSLSSHLKDGKTVLLQALKACPEAQVQWPTAPEMEIFASMISARQPELQGVFGFVDGLNLAIFKPPYGEEQNAYYNGWLGGCYASSIFVFAPDGTIIWATVNWPGSWPDGKLAKELYVLLKDIPDGFAIAADSAFSRADMANKIVRPLVSIACEILDATIY